jgi:hypothetical protein
MNLERRQIRWNEDERRWESSREVNLPNNAIARLSYDVHYEVLAREETAGEAVGQLGMLAAVAGAIAVERGGQLLLQRLAARATPLAGIGASGTTAGLGTSTARNSVLGDAEMIERARQIHRELILADFGRHGVLPTEEQIGRAMSQGTVSIVQTEVREETIRIVTTNNPGLDRLLRQSGSQFLQEGETLGSRPIAVYGPQRGQRLYIHAEQVGVNDAVALGGTEGTVASSNPGCASLCVSTIEEYFPGFTHVNPKAMKR